MIIEFSDSEIKIIKSGLNQPFWKILKKAVGNMVDILQKDILENDGLKEKCEITERDLTRLDWKRTKWFLELPEKISESGGKIETKNTNYDPYE